MKHSISCGMKLLHLELFNDNIKYNINYGNSVDCLRVHCSHCCNQPIVSNPSHIAALFSDFLYLLFVVGTAVIVEIEHEYDENWTSTENNTYLLILLLNFPKDEDCTSADDSPR